MPDPNVVLAAASGVAGAGVLAHNVSKGLGRILGPTADVVGDTLAQYTEFRLRNIRRVAEKAARRLGDRIDDPGEVHPRVVHRVIDEGSWSDDDVVCEYLGGVLAASRSAGSDDDGVAWATLVNRLSAATVRTHYVIYTALRQVLLDRGEHPDLNSGTILGHHTLYIPSDVYTAAMGLAEGSAEETAGAAVAMLDREVLIGEHWTVSFDDEDPLLDQAGAPGPGIVVTPTHVGIELYLWGMGRRTMDLPALAEDDLAVELPSVMVPRGALVLDPTAPGDAPAVAAPRR